VDAKQILFNRPRIFHQRNRPDLATQSAAEAVLKLREFTESRVNSLVPESIRNDIDKKVEYLKSIGLRLTRKVAPDMNHVSTEIWIGEKLIGTIWSWFDINDSTAVFKIGYEPEKEPNAEQPASESNHQPK
jgi:hypothetical protein